jgi:polar amino acid transport system substrate-binding protein
MRRRIWAAVVAISLLTGCTSQPPRSDRIGATAEVPYPQNVQDPAAVPTTTAQPPQCDPRASLRPRLPMPPPGQMPAGSRMDEIARRGRLVVGVDLNAYLFSYRDPTTGRLVGFDIDVAREIARAIFGSTEAVQFRSVTTADRIKVLQDGSVDVVVRTFTSTCERAQQVAFSTEYLSTGQRVLVNRGSGHRGIGDLGGKKVCAARGATSIPVIQQAASKPIAVAADTTLDCLVLLQQGQVAAVSTIDVLLVALAAQDPGTEIVGDPLSDEPSSVGVAKNAPELVRFVNGVLERMRTDGTWRRMYEQWLSRLGPTPAPPLARYLD